MQLRGRSNGPVGKVLAVQYEGPSSTTTTHVKQTGCGSIDV